MPRSPRCSRVPGRSASATGGAFPSWRRPSSRRRWTSSRRSTTASRGLASYAGLRLTTNVNGEDERDLNAAVEIALVELQNLLRFFELEWIAVDDEHAARVLADERLVRNRHYLASARRFAPHTRSEPEEEMLAERDPASAGAWHTLFDQITSTLRVPFDGEDRTIDEVLARVRGPVRETRLAAYEALFTALEPETPVLAHIYDSLVADRLVLDRVRGYKHPREARDLDNELPSEAVDVLLAAVERHHHLAHRWFRHKAKLLGLDKLALADQYAPLGSTRAVAYDDRHRAGGRCARRLLAAHRCRCARPLPRQAHRRRAALGQARGRLLRLDRPGRAAVHHAELHGSDGRRAHDRARDRPRDAGPAGRRAPLRALRRPPLALAEVPSTFAEMIVTDRLLAAAERQRRCASGCSRAPWRRALRDGLRRRHAHGCVEQGAYGLPRRGQGSS